MFFSLTHRSRWTLFNTRSHVSTSPGAFHTQHCLPFLNTTSLTITLLIILYLYINIIRHNTDNAHILILLINHFLTLLSYVCISWNLFVMFEPKLWFLNFSIFFFFFWLWNLGKYEHTDIAKTSSLSYTIGKTGGGGVGIRKNIWEAVPFLSVT